MKLNVSLLWSVETQRLASMGARQVAFGNFQTALMSFNFRCSFHTGLFWDKFLIQKAEPDILQNLKNIKAEETFHFHKLEKSHFLMFLKKLNSIFSNQSPNTPRAHP